MWLWGVRWGQARHMLAVYMRVPFYHAQLVDTIIEVKLLCKVKLTQLLSWTAGNSEQITNSGEELVILNVSLAAPGDWTRWEEREANRGERPLNWRMRQERDGFFPANEERDEGGGDSQRSQPRRMTDFSSRLKIRKLQSSSPFTNPLCPISFAPLSHQGCLPKAWCQEQNFRFCTSKLSNCPLLLLCDWSRYFSLWALRFFCVKRVIMVILLPEFVEMR